MLGVAAAGEADRADAGAIEDEGSVVSDYWASPVLANWTNPICTRRRRPIYLMCSAPFRCWTSNPIAIEKGSRALAPVSPSSWSVVGINGEPPVIAALSGASRKLKKTN
jgi:hypothetical protein